MIRNRNVWKGMIVLLALSTCSQALETVARAQSAAAEAQLTILVRDADGNPLPNVRLEMFLPQPPAEPRGVADVMTGADGRVTVQRLVPDQTYVLQFTSGVAVILNGQRVDSKPVQFKDDQNAGRELSSPVDPPGFAAQMGGQMQATLRFVIGGTFSDAELAAAVPMFDLAEADDAPVRPVNPLTGDEMTPEQARTFHAVIGEPWGVARGGETSPEPQANGSAPSPFASVDAVPLSSAAGGTPSSSPSATGSPVPLLLVGVIVLLAAVIGVLLMRQRRRLG